MPWPWLFSFFRKTGAGPESHSAGVWGEQVAAVSLAAKGYRILGRNIRFGSRCELDLVARAPDSETLVFIEVKTRRAENFGRPMTAVDRNKRRALGRAALRYLHRVKARPARIRFDVVEVVGVPDAESPVIRHIENAFSLGPGYRLPW